MLKIDQIPIARGTCTIITEPFENYTTLEAASQLYITGTATIR